MVNGNELIEQLVFNSQKISTLCANNLALTEQCSIVPKYAYMNLWLIIAVTHTTWAVVKLEPEQIQAWMVFELMTYVNHPLKRE